jgi:hypothetical protein
MKINSNVRSVLLISLTVAVFFSCTPLRCIEETEAYLKISLYEITNDKLQAPDSITVYGLNMESEKIYNRSTSITQIDLPLNNAADSCEFIIRINGINDTVKFKYSSFPHLISKECGYSYFHTLDTARNFTDNVIKNIRVWNGNITNLNEENIRLYY